MAQNPKSKRRKSNNRDQWRVYVSIGLVLLAGAALIWYANKSGTSQPSLISVDEAHQKYGEGAFFLDVREPDEWQEKHIPDATLIPLGQLADNLEHLPKDQEIVIYCRTGNRSQQALSILSEAGFKNASSMDGGITDWITKGYEVETGN